MNATEILGDLVLSARILALEGHEQFYLGHVSARVPGHADHVLIKRTGVALASVTEADFLRIDLDGTILSGDGALHHETPIHTEIYRRRPDVAAVVHTHPHYTAALAASNADFLLVSQDSIPFFKGLARYASPELVSTRAAGADMAAALGNANAMIMNNHGLTVGGPDIQHATFLALSLERSLATQSRAASLGTVAVIDTEHALRMHTYFEQQYQGRVGMVWDYFKAKLIDEDTRGLPQ